MVTKEEIEAAKTPNGGWTRETLAEWGVPWPPPKGWKTALIKGSGVPEKSVVNVTKEKIVEITHCPKCGKSAGDPCRIGADGRPKSHHERLHAAQLIVNLAKRRKNHDKPS